ncbi:hypothetical protein BC629DRAFT_1649354 [Irpex lacteus]|nr:hypothetical protein BC629DRAFT_1649354 [Irpex lacteus]
MYSPHNTPGYPHTQSSSNVAPSFSFHHTVHTSSITGTIAPSQLSAPSVPVSSLPSPFDSRRQLNGGVNYVTSHPRSPYSPPSDEHSTSSGNNLLANAASILAGSSVHTSHFHQLLAMFLIAAAADPLLDSLALPSPVSTTNAGNEWWVSLLDGFETDLQSSASVELQASTPGESLPSLTSDSAEWPQEWFEMSLDPSPTEEAAGYSRGEALLLSDEGWEATTLEDLISSWVDLDAASSPDGSATPQNEPTADVNSSACDDNDLTEHPLRRTGSMASLLSTQSSSSVSSAGGGYQRLYSDAEVDEDMATPLLSNAEPPAPQVTSEVGRPPSCEDEKPPLFDSVNGWLRCLQAEYDPDNVIGSCEMALQRLMEEARCTTPP